MDYFHIKGMLKQVRTINEAEHQKEPKQQSLSYSWSSHFTRFMYIYILSLYYQDGSRGI